MPGGEVPAVCAHELFSDTIATLGGDVVLGVAKPQRIYGLTGDDWLIGSPNRASCLFGGRGNDVLTLGAGGGVSLGERGDDTLTGSQRTDALSGGDGDDILAGRGGKDILRADKGTDALDGGAGDDILDAADGRAELVNCGAGRDVVLADGADVLLACESSRLSGPPLRVKEARFGRSGIARLRFTVPVTATAGEWRVVLATCDGGLREAARLPAVRRGRKTRIGLPPPPGGWCAAARTGAIVRVGPCKGTPCVGEQPPVPLAYVRF